MTQPIQEPGTDRALQGFAFQRDQLLRRPRPAAASGAHWMALWDDANGISYASNAGIHKFYWEEGTQSDGSDDIFLLAPASDPGVGFDITIPYLLVDGVYTFTLMVEWSGASQANVQTTYNLLNGNGDLWFPGQCTLNTLETRRLRILANFNDRDWVDEINFTVPIHLGDESPTPELEAFVSTDSLFSSQNWTDAFTSRFWVTYHGALNDDDFADWC